MIDAVVSVVMLPVLYYLIKATYKAYINLKNINK